MDVSPLLLSVWVAACATFFSVVLGTLAAYGVMKLRRLRPFADAVLTLPLVLPPTVTGFFLLILLGKNSPVGRFYIFPPWGSGSGICGIFSADVSSGQGCHGIHG